jgi:cytochrome c oxidase cbb3-type subunit 1
VRAKNAGARKRLFWIFFLFSGVIFAALDHTHAPSSSLGQQAGLGVLVLWIPSVWVFFRTFDWSPSSRPWLTAAFVWWLLLVITGFLIFLPAISERLKFTNALVSHAHLAMAGLLTSLNIAILNLLIPTQPVVRGFWVWQLSTAIHVVTLAVLGWLEPDRLGALFLRSDWTQAFYGLRLACGLIMCWVSAMWFLNRPPAINPID